jgi:eukaryotic-like serine/threonine-protein kinase
MSLPEPGLEIVPGLTLLRRLGRGGMGDAWLARDAARGEDVAAKVLPADASAERVALLRREARLVRKLSHARIVPVYEFREGERGSVVTQRYMPGGDAGRRRGASPVEVVRLGRDVAEALDYLHGLGVVHRDVKPSNVLLDEAGRAHLGDFGIAAVAAGDEDGIALRGGGSRASMSPQQAAGDPAQPADDLYALGALLFELLSGRPVRSRDVSDEDVRTHPPPPVTSAFPLSDSLRSLVATLLSEAPEKRPRSAAAVRTALEAIEAELGDTQPSPPRPLVRLQPPPRVAEAAVIAPIGPRQSGERPRIRQTSVSSGQLTLLAGLALAALVAVIWLPRWARTPQPATASPSSASSPAVAIDETPVPSGPSPLATPSAAPPSDPPSADAESTPALAPALGPTPPPALELSPPTPLPVPTPDRLKEAEALARHRDAGRAFEEQEEWRAALAEYEAALSVDPHLAFALEGRARATERAALADGLAFHTQNPLRLSSEPVAREAEALLERARGLDSPGARLRAQMAALENALASARTSVPVVIESDGLTEVTVSRVGRLGTLTRRTLALRPGSYTAVGSRRGYRDVRRQFTVSPSGAVPAIVVRCEEGI